MSHYPQLYRESLALLTDFYQLTMAYGYWKEGLQHKESVFHYFFRYAPFQGGFTVSAGLESLIDFIRRFRFEPSDIDYLRTLRAADQSPYFSEEFLTYLLNLRLKIDLDAVPEGTIVFPFEPIIRVTGPLIHCQLLETILLNLMNFPSLVATKAARVRLAAGTDTIIEFGLRRAQGIDGGITATRAAYIGGVDSTSNVVAGRLFGIPVKGTHSHSWVMAFEDEETAFEAYARAMPNNCLLLVDTYNTLEGVRRAIRVAQKLRTNGFELHGIRLDSGDLAYLSIKARELLDDAGFAEAKIIASNELDEHLIAELKRQGAKINVWGVGTNLVTAKDDPALGGVYKVSAIRDPGGPWQYRLKLSEQMSKISNPGILQIGRFTHNGEHIADMIYDVELGHPEQCSLIDPFDPTRKKIIAKHLKAVDLLIPIFRHGECVYESPSLEFIKQSVQTNLRQFYQGIKRFVFPHQYVVGMEAKLYQLKVNLIESIRESIRSNK